MDKVRIMLVEDESIIAKDMQISLKKLGYTVPPALTSGEEALQEIEKNKPDLVLMDIVLQGKMDGIETAWIIRSRFDVPVIYVTAYGDDKALERAKITEPFGYMIKPFEERELHITIEIALYKHKAENERKKLMLQLEEAFARIKTLDGLLPICANCKKIRDDKGYWNQIESYIKDHSNADFTHSICPECVKKLYPDISSHK